MPALSGPRQLEPPLQQVGPNEESGAWEWRRAGGQPGIDPQPGEGTALPESVEEGKKIIPMQRLATQTPLRLKCPSWTEISAQSSTIAAGPRHYPTVMEGCEDEAEQTRRERGA
ncbi:Ribosomal RNA large subunit methyltransferase K/L [Dissostichus eleginoides]|uniref:Ribosomal RNA large subunit methyltransferase K/L n=1 Tax=Dissostichus eleginoides TaxID=100907 RepID=A0AAD9CC70_DISEL|nr:Ribosomal RNA large subunit methyltransferase K/L [Dissostichus eleginoides]